MALMDTSKTDKQIVDEANELARGFYKLLGYRVARGYRFDSATHPQERLCWRMAALAFAELRATDIDDALSAQTEGQG